MGALTTPKESKELYSSAVDDIPEVPPAVEPPTRDPRPPSWPSLKAASLPPPGRPPPEQRASSTPASPTGPPPEPPPHRSPRRATATTRASAQLEIDAGLASQDQFAAEPDPEPDPDVRGMVQQKTSAEIRNVRGLFQAGSGSLSWV